MQRYFILNQENWSSNQVKITGEDVHHIRKVMRSKSGDQIICADNGGRAALCTIRDIDEDQVIAEIIEQIETSSELPVQVTIVQGLPKGDKFELILQKGTELGAVSFIPYKADRSIVVWDERKMRKKMQRYEKIVKEASEQSHRNRIPVIQDALGIKELADLANDYDYKLIAYEEEAKADQHQSFGNILKRIKHGMKVLICIGPEGGFSENEVNRLKESGFHSVRFGPRILRTETAALYALASISYHFEELGCEEWQK